MLQKNGFANSLAVTSGAAYVLFYILSLAAPALFKILLNASAMGADVSSLWPRSLAIGDFILNLVVIMVWGWAFGYVWAWIYAKTAK